MTERFLPPHRILLGPGPSNVSPRVLEAMARPLIGHLDPDFLSLMNGIQADLRQVFRTSNPLTLPISGTGSAAMEASILNFVQPGDRALVGINGIFGMRLAEIVRRAGGECHVVQVPFGQPLDLDELRRRALDCRPSLVAVVHAETSTGVLQPIPPVRRICEETGALLLVDVVTSLGGHPVLVDEWGIDIAYGGTQKCLSCPPGLAPLTVSPPAVRRLLERAAPCQSWYLDLRLLTSYWGQERTYHHTAPINMNYALHEALRLVLEEGLEARWNRHEVHHQALVRGLEAMGLEMLVEPAYRLWSLNAVRIPPGIDDAGIRGELLSRFAIEIGGGLGELKGRIWRIGLMGESSSPENVLYFLHALETCLSRAGWGMRPGQGVQASAELLRHSSLADRG